MKALVFSTVLVGFLAPAFSVTFSGTAAQAEDVIRASPLYLTFVPDTPWEVVLNISASNCTEHDTTDSMTIAYHSPETNLTYLIAAISKGTFANTGPNLDSVTHNCSNDVFNSTFNWRPESYANYQWLQSVHIFPNGSIIGLIHNEFHGFSDQDRALGYCTIPRSREDGNVCNMWSTGLGISHDGGQTFEVLGAPPMNRVFSAPYQYQKNQHGFGYGALSVMFEGEDGAFYGYVGVAGHEAQPNGLCAFRSENVFDPAAYRGWGGETFNVTFADPYIGQINPLLHTCKIVDSLQNSGLHPTPRRLVWTADELHRADSKCSKDNALPSYIMFNEKSGTAVQYKYSWEDDFAKAAITWDPDYQSLDLGLERYLHFEGRVIYPTLLDSNSVALGSVNYDVLSNNTGYMYVNIQRNLLRRRVHFTDIAPIPPPPPPAPIPSTCTAISVSGAANRTTNCEYFRTAKIIDNSPVWVCNNSTEPQTMSIYREEGIWRIAIPDVVVIYAASQRNTTMPPTSGWRYFSDSHAAPSPDIVRCAD